MGTIPYYSLEDLKESSIDFQATIFETKIDWRFLDYANNAVHIYKKLI